MSLFRAEKNKSAGNNVNHKVLTSEAHNILFENLVQTQRDPGVSKVVAFSEQFLVVMDTLDDVIDGVPAETRPSQRVAKDGGRDGSVVATGQLQIRIGRNLRRVPPKRGDATTPTN